MKTLSKIFLLLVSCLLLLVVFVFSQWSRQTGLNSKYWRSTLFSALKTSTQPTLNIMILGLDKRDDSLEHSSVTDTIILAHADFQKGTIHIFSLPRDLWDYSLNSKINEIYPNSLKLTDKYEQFNYIKNNFSRITGQKIDNVLVLTTDNLKELADLLGGVDLYLENSFISAPATKAFSPLPVMMMQLTDFSSFRKSNALSRSVKTCAFRALRLSGLLMVRIAILLSKVKVMLS